MSREYMNSKAAIISRNLGYYDIQSSVLENNFIHILVDRVNGNNILVNSSRVESTIFRTNSSTAQYSNVLTLPPHVNHKTLYGVWVRQNNNLTIGRSGLSNQFQNQFRDMVTGVRIINATVTVINNTFTNLHPRNFNQPINNVFLANFNNSFGTAIVSVSNQRQLSSPRLYNLTVGGNSTNVDNIFTNCLRSVWTDNLHDVIVQGNTIQYNNTFGLIYYRARAIEIRNSLTDNQHFAVINIIDNTINGGQLGIRTNNVARRAILSINENNIDFSSYSPFQFLFFIPTDVATGIDIIEPSPSVSSIYSLDYVENNTIDEAYIGIRYTNFPFAEIERNQITLLGNPTGSTSNPKIGIIGSNSLLSPHICNDVKGHYNKVVQNHIEYGFEITTNLACRYEFNEGENLTSNFRFSGINTSTQLKRNIMREGETGIHLYNGGVIGNQFTGFFVPNDNEWVGSTWDNHLLAGLAFTTFTNGSLSPFSLRIGNTTRPANFENNIGSGSPPPGSVFPITNFNTTATLQQNNCLNDQGSIAASEMFDREFARKVLLDSIEYSSDSVFEKWWFTYQLYRSLSVNDTLVTLDSLYAPFISSYADTANWLV